MNIIDELNRTKVFKSFDKGCFYIECRSVAAIISFLKICVTKGYTWRSGQPIVYILEELEEEYRKAVLEYYYYFQYDAFYKGITQMRLKDKLNGVYEWLE